MIATVLENLLRTTQVPEPVQPQVQKCHTFREHADRQPGRRPRHQQNGQGAER
jgi:hypothetical protein